MPNYLTALFLLNRARSREAGASAKNSPVVSRWPRVTVQLPVYNEPAVVAQLIDTIVQLDYPRDRLEIQFLDDSTDETTALAMERVDHYRRQHYHIELIRRTDRKGYKAGNLRNGLIRALGDYIVMFDADFLPGPNFLKETIPHFVANPRLGFIQTRWGHLNRHVSPLTAAQAVMLDGQFVVEHVARNQSGYLINFNGTAGVWRLDCIEEAGNWQYDTLFEDFDQRATPGSSLTNDNSPSLLNS